MRERFSVSCMTSTIAPKSAGSLGALFIAWESSRVSPAWLTRLVKTAHYGRLNGTGGACRNRIGTQPRRKAENRGKSKSADFLPTPKSFLTRDESVKPRLMEIFEKQNAWMALDFC